MKEITINGKATPIHFGMRAVAEFTKRQESDFAENITTTAAVREYRQHRRTHGGGAQRGRTTLRQRAPLYGGRRVGHLRRGAASGAGGLATLRREHLAADRKVGRYGKKRSCGGEEEVGDRRITYELWFSIAVGQMSMRPEDFEVLTPAEFIYAWLGWSEREQSLQRQSWERERWAVWVLTSIQLDRKEPASDDPRCFRFRGKRRAHRHRRR